MKKISALLLVMLLASETSIADGINMNNSNIGEKATLINDSGGNNKINSENITNNIGTKIVNVRTINGSITLIPLVQEKNIDKKILNMVNYINLSENKGFSEIFYNSENKKYYIKEYNHKNPKIKNIAISNNNYKYFNISTKNGDVVEKKTVINIGNNNSFVAVESYNLGPTYQPFSHIGLDIFK